MTFTQLLYFTTVVKYNSITKAAKSLYVSQPAVSLAIKQLEEEFGAVLFLRNNNQLELTEEGKYFNTLAIRLLDEYKNVEERMHRYVRKAEVLRIGIPPMLGAFLFPPILEEFSKEHPDVQVELTEYGSIQNRRAVENHEIDIALTVIEGDDISKNLEYQKIGRTHLIFMVDKNSRLAGRTSLDIEDIADEPLVIMKQDCLQAKIVFDEYKKHNINPNVKIRTNQLTTMRELIATGKYGGFLFHQLSKSDEELVGIPFENPLELNIVVAWNRNAKMTPIINSFIDFITHKVEAK